MNWTQKNDWKIHKMTKILVNSTFKDVYFIQQFICQNIRNICKEQGSLFYQINIYLSKYYEYLQIARVTVL